ncbi:MAG: preprotein translocase subunit YajC [Thermodesulfobacteriota bacterium]
MFADIAYAMAQPPGGEGQGPGMFQTLVPMVLIFVVFYFLLIRPQQKRAKEHKELLENLKKGDSVITQGGIYGQIVAVADNVLTVEIADKVRVRVARSHVAGLATDKPTESAAITPGSS